MGWEEGRAERIAAVQREFERLEALDQALRLVPHTDAGPLPCSVVYSLRLDPAELAALRARAQASGLKPTVLARNLIRCGLAVPDGALLARAVWGLEEVLARLRALEQ